MKRSSALLLIVVAVIGLIVAVAASILHNGLSARSNPTRMEESIARNLWHLSIPAGARATPNPIANTSENLTAARLHFADHCAVCHGNDGSGDTLFGRGLYPKPPDLRQSATQNRSDGELFWIIENGRAFYRYAVIFRPSHAGRLLEVGALHPPPAATHHRRKVGNVAQQPQKPR